MQKFQKFQKIIFRKCKIFIQKKSENFKNLSAKILKIMKNSSRKNSKIEFKKSEENYEIRKQKSQKRQRENFSFNEFA